MKLLGADLRAKNKKEYLFKNKPGNSLIIKGLVRKTNRNKAKNKAEKLLRTLEG
jgi:hypothetical protein